MSRRSRRRDRGLGFTIPRTPTPTVSSTTTRATATITLVRLPVARQARVCRARAGRRTSADICATPGPSCCRPSGTGTPSEMPPTGCFRRVPGWAGRADARFARHDGDDDHTIDSCRHLGLELRPLGRRALSRRPACREAAGLLRRQLRHRRTQCQLLPVAPAGQLRELAPAVAARVPDVGEGTARPHPRQEALRPRDLGRADRGRLP